MKHWFVCMLISLAMLLLGIGCSTVVFAGLVCWPWQLSWSQTEGKVTNIDCFSRNNARFVYLYFVEGRAITSWEFFPRSLCSTVKQDSKVLVRYNPKNASDSAM